MTQANRFLDCEMEIKKLASGIVIEGYANAATVDRMNEMIDPKGWALDNYKKNPVVLFDHGHDPQFGTMPIGKAMEVAADEKGLYAKIKLSNSKTEKISAVRDLVEEGILRTFSVGFAPLNKTKSEDGSHTVITNAELIECSVVPVPMNQDSTFSLMGKRGIAPSVKKWLKARMELDTAKKRSMWVAAAVHHRLIELMNDSSFDREVALERVADKAGTTVAEIRKCLSGYGIPEQVVKAFSSVLGIDESLLNNISKLEMPATVASSSSKSQGEDHGESKKSEKGTEESSKESTQESQEVVDTQGKGELSVLAVMVPKSIAATEEEAKAFCEAQGIPATSWVEEGDMWNCAVVPSEQIDLASSQQVLLGNGAKLILGPKVSETPADDTAEEQAEGELPEIETEGKTSDDTEKSQEIIESKNGIGMGEQDQNPHLHEARQTNILLGALIHEIKLLSSKMTGQVEKPAPATEEVVVSAPAPADEQAAGKSFEILKNCTAEVNLVLKRLREMAQA